MFNKKYSIIIFLTAFVFGILINELNIRHLIKLNKEGQTINTKSTIYNYCIYSVDNAWYLPQIKHMLNGKGYTIDPKNKELRVRRTPGYPLFYGIHYILFGEKLSFFFIRLTQLLLFSLSALLLSWSVFNFTKDDKWALLSGLLYGLSPFVASYLYYTITEALFPAFVIFPIYFLSLYKKKEKPIFLLISGCFVGIVFLIRPLTGIILPGILIYLVKFNKPFIKLNLNRFKPILLVILGFIISISPWVIHNYKITRELIIGEKFYFGAPMNYGKSHVELRYLVSCWTNPANISIEVLSNTIIKNINSGKKELNENVINEFIEKWPEKAFKGFSRYELQDALLRFNDCYVHKNKLKEEDTLIKRKYLLTQDCEKEVANLFIEMRNSFISESPFSYYVVTPIKTILELIFQSNSSNIGSLNPVDRNFNYFQFVVKGFMYVLNVLLYLSLLYFITFYKKPNIKLFIVTPVLLLLFGLSVFLFRYIESRYLLPIYPLLYVCFAFMVLNILNKLKLGKLKHKVI